MIVVIGSPAYAAPAEPGDAPAAGLAAAIATASATSGAEVQLVGRVGDDRPGDALLLALAARGVRHAAVIRDAGRPTRRAPALAPDEDEPLVPIAPIDEAAAAGETDRAAGADGAATPPPVRAPRPATGEPEGEAPGLDAGDLALALGYLVDARVVVVAEPLADDAAVVVADAAAFTDAALVAIVLQDAVVPPAFDGATVLVAPEDDAAGAFARLVGRFAAALDTGASPGEAFERARSADGWEASPA